MLRGSIILLKTLKTHVEIENWSALKIMNQEAPTNTTDTYDLVTVSRLDTVKWIRTSHEFTSICAYKRSNLKEIQQDKLDACMILIVSYSVFRVKDAEQSTDLGVKCCITNTPCDCQPSKEQVVNPPFPIPP